MNYTHCKIRNIARLRVTTPVLVPSFSSKGFNDLNYIYNEYKEELVDATLVSAYDLYHKNISVRDIYETDILIVDSGGYERNKDHDLSTIYSGEYIPRQWSRNLYKEQIDKVENLTATILVNYDHIEQISLENQVELAHEDFENHRNFASDFLCKPSGDEPYLDVDDYCNNIELIKDFSILGFTEKTIGESLLQRCKNIYRIRKELEKHELEIPIHIFGCIDPKSIVVYFLSGADIFDGLSWLRFSFSNSRPTYFNNHALENGLWDYKDEEMRSLAILDNIKELELLNEKLQEFTISKDISIFHFEENTELQIERLLAKVREGD